MDPLFQVSDVLATAPGTSPFHVRGVFYDQVRKHAAQEPGGLRAFLSEIRDDGARQFMSQRFGWADWYDAIPMVPVQAALCRLQDGDFETLVRKRSRAAGESLVPRVFRMLLGLGSPQAAATHIPRLLAYYFDFGEVRIETGKTTGKGQFMNVPRVIAPSYVNTLIGFIEGGLRLMGAKLVEASYSDVAAGPPLHGFATISCQANFRWVK
jgi:hypothetical protein